ncbi:type II toxin-antitoxin system PrlF family antitoxin [Vreelandella sulfidaeris]
MTTSTQAYTTLSDHYQTMVPKSVCQALKLKPHDRIHYTIRANGEVILSRANDESSQEFVKNSFLAFLEHDLLEHPENIRLVTNGAFAAAERLTSGIDVDLDEVLPVKDDDA